MRLDILLPMRDHVLGPVLKSKGDGVKETVERARSYGLTRDDIMEELPRFGIASVSTKTASVKGLPGKVKAALTRLSMQVARLVRVSF